MKIGIVGDLHIAPAPPNRLDDYFQVGLNKIEEIAQVCDYVVFLGDIFSNARVEESILIKFISHIYYLKAKYGVEFATIIGNHDVPGEDEANLFRTSLGILGTIGAFKIITPETPLVLENYRFNTIPVRYRNAVNYDFNIYGKDGYTDILLVHHEYETGTYCFTYDDFKDCGAKMVFFGHDHKPMEGGRAIYPEFTAYRSGSIMRNRADDYNFTRQLYYYIIEDGVVSCRAINQAPADKVFAIEALTKINYNQRKFTESIDNLIDKYKNNAVVGAKFSMRGALQEVNTPEANIDYIRSKYELKGEVFS